MSAPEGYTALDFVGFTDKGEYDATATYVQNDLVRYNYDIWKCTTDDTTGETPSVGSPYWTIFIETGSGETVQAQIADIVNVYGSKNLLSYPYYESTKTQNGVTFTDNGDGTVTVNGTATADTYYTLHSRYQNDVNNLILKNGTYTLTGSPSSASVTTSYLKIGRTNGGTYQEYGADIGSGVTVTLNGDDYSPNEVEIQLQIVVKSGATVTNFTFRPMLRLASIEDDTYVPYVPTNAKLDEEKMSWKANGVLGAKNLIPYPYYETTKTSNGITFTDNGDGTVTANGTATADAGMTLRLTSLKGSYILSDYRTNFSSNIYMQVYMTASPYTVYASTANGEAKFSLTSATNIAIGIRIKNGTTVNNLVFKPMLRLAEDTDDTYQPYAMTNYELTQKIADLQAQINALI